jgi:hypothetical protein
MMVLRGDLILRNASFIRNISSPLAFASKYWIQIEKKEKVLLYFVFSFLSMLRSLLE